MHTFKDNAGRTWTVALNVDTIKAVRDLTKVNLLEAVEGKLLERLANDPILLCDVLYALVKTEADKANISDADFGRALYGDAIDAATTALLEELVDFFPKRRRGMVNRTLRLLLAVDTKAVALAEKKLDAVNADEVVESAFAKFGTLSGS